MFNRLVWLAPLMGALTFSPSLLDEGCGGGDDDDTVTPTPHPTPPPGLTDKERFDQYLIDLEQAASTEAQEQLTSDFIYTIQYSDGFPIIDGNTVTFLYIQEYGINEPLSVSGDFNGWSTTATPLMRAVPDYWAFYATVSLADPLAWSMYKFVGRDGSNQDVWFADAHSRRYQYDENGEYSLIHGGTQSQKSHLERYPLFHSDVLGNDRDLFLYLPPGYDHESSTYPVIYMHDGQNLFDPEASYGGWQVDDVIDGLLSAGQMQEVVVVGMANTGDRMDEYTHVEDFLPAYGGYIGGDAEPYAEFVVNEVKPFIDARYRTRADRDSTAVLGSSLGGLVSYYMGWAYTDVFKYVGGMSSTFGWGSLTLNNPTMIENLDDAAKLPNIYYLDSGGDDGGGCVDADSDGIEDDNPNADDNFCETAQMNGVLESTGYSSSELLYVWAPGQEHNEASWHSRMHYPLTFWFPAQ